MNATADAEGKGGPPGLAQPPAPRTAHRFKLRGTAARGPTGGAAPSSSDAAGPVRLVLAPSHYTTNAMPPGPPPGLPPPYLPPPYVPPAGLPPPMTAHQAAGYDFRQRKSENLPGLPPLAPAPPKPNPEPQPRRPRGPTKRERELMAQVEQLRAQLVAESEAHLTTKTSLASLQARYDALAASNNASSTQITHDSFDMQIGELGFLAAESPSLALLSSLSPFTLGGDSHLKQQGGVGRLGVIDEEEEGGAAGKAAAAEAEGEGEDDGDKALANLVDAFIADSANAHAKLTVVEAAMVAAATSSAATTATTSTAAMKGEGGEGEQAGDGSKRKKQRKRKA